jgi:hypothetical protein
VREAKGGTSNQRDWHVHLLRCLRCSTVGTVPCSVKAGAEMHGSALLLFMPFWQMHMDRDELAGR